MPHPMLQRTLATSLTFPAPLVLAALVLLAAAACWAASGWAASGSVMYRFSNDLGEPVYSYTLPPGQAAKGYDKVDVQTGRVLQTVAAQLPPDLLAEKLAREEALRDCRDELDRIYQLYGREADIAQAEQQALASLDTRISQIQANLRQARREQDRLRDQAADIERSGRQIPAPLLENIRRSQSQISSLDIEIVQRRDEQDQARARFQHELERFRDGTCPAGAPAIAAP